MSSRQSVSGGFRPALPWHWRRATPFFSPGDHSNSGAQSTASPIRTPLMPPGTPNNRRTGRLGSIEFNPDQLSPASTLRHTPAAFETVISSAFTGETAKSDSGAPRIELPLYAVRLTHAVPLSSERNAFLAKLYNLEPDDLTRAPGSGLFNAAGSLSAGGKTEPSAAGFQVSKSEVRNVRPVCVFAYRVPPSAEYHTRSTGPVAADGSASSIAEFPICRHPASTCAHADVAAVASDSIPTIPRTVALRHIGRVYYILSARTISILLSESIDLFLTELLRPSFCFAILVLD